MPRLPDIHAAFVAAVQLNTKGYRCLHTKDFVGTLRERNWHFTLKSLSPKHNLTS